MGNIIRKTFILLAIFGSCFIFLLFNEKGLQDLEKDGSYPVILKFSPNIFSFPYYLYMWSSCIFMAEKSLLTGNFRAVGFLIWFGLFCSWDFRLIIGSSFKGHFYEIMGTNVLQNILLHAYPFNCTAFTAIFTRILAYGYTEPRYFVLLLAAAQFRCFILLFSRKTTIKFVPVSLFAFGLFSLIFPLSQYFFSRDKKSEKGIERGLSSK